MKKLIAASILFTLTAIEANRLIKTEETYDPIAQTGDLIFQTEVGNSNAFAIQVATLSVYNHVGVVVKEKDGFYVYEALGSVKKTSLDNYVNRKQTGSRFVVYRHEDITAQSQRKIKNYLKRKTGIPYDTKLSWNDKKMYCSELAYKAITNSDLNLADPQKMEDLTLLTHVSKIIPSSYVFQLNKDENIVSPGYLSKDNNLKKVYQNW